MTTNDAQIDVLLRRYAGRPQSNSATEHLDADELNAFAEGSLPEASRSRYVSHLADCDDCRKVVSQLAISGGAVVAAEATRAADSPGYSWWKRFSGFFTPLSLRYAAFAVVLVTVVGVVLLVTRQQRQSNFIARNESTNQPQVSAVKPAEAAPPEAIYQQEKPKADQSSTTAQPETSPAVSKAESKAGEISPQPPAAPSKPEQETYGTTSPALAAKKAADPANTESSPSYAPPPPVETDRAQNVSREQQQNLPGQVASGPRKSEPSNDKFKMMDRSRGGEMSKDVGGQDDNRAMNQSQANVQRAADEKVTSGRDVDTLSSRARNAKESRAQPPATQSTGGGKRDGAEEAPETRSAGGRKFRRQGSSWVDSKFKSSMVLKSISRGSSEFDALDSGLRSIAQQLGGEVIVVWKNKAYVIK
jgi:hypothetical protein